VVPPSEPALRIGSGPVVLDHLMGDAEAEQFVADQPERGRGRVYPGGMSIPVAIEDLAAATGEYGWAYLLTVRDDFRPHIVAVTPTWDTDHLVMSVGRGTARNAGARPAISLCYPPVNDGGYSLIVDGTAAVDGEGTVRFAPTGAVLHRPAPDGFTSSTTGCGNDCEPVGPSGG